MGPPKMVGTSRDRLEAGAGAERKSGGGRRNIHKRNCRDNNGDDGDGDIPLAGETKDAGIVRVRISVLRRQNTVAQFVATRPILGLCEGMERRGGTWVPQQWWEQHDIDWRLSREQGERATEEAAGHTHTDATAGKKTTTTEAPGSGKGTGEEASLGASGSSGEEWSGAEY